ncbi:hypothetical protein [Anaerovorax sp. IOR16]|uniref:hypothetical protein n=1 Tax=Anaerovorax sp. IOR16 TaxID=2773458 RepID=UPI0019CFB9F2|nr:hypothetical protein [Anaerovorax sp. IOR16]
MPNRIIKESICTSDSIEKLSWFEEAFFYRLMVNCDDYGRTDARLAILKSRLFPLKSVTEKQVGECLNKLATVGMIFLYEYDEKPYLQLLSWEKHQNVRTKKSKYPPMDIKTVDDLLKRYEHLHTDENTCGTNPIQSESESKSEVLPEAEPASSSPAAISLMLNDKSLYPITQEQVNKWSKLYPAVDVMQELRKMVGWLEANPKRRKTSSGILRFITNWLAGEQDKGNKGMFTPVKNKQVVDGSKYETDSSFIRG